MPITSFVHIARLVGFGPVDPVAALSLPVPVWRLLARVTVTLRQTYVQIFILFIPDWLDFSLAS